MSVADERYLELGNQGFTGSMQDRWNAKLTSYGLTGSFSDKLKQYLLELGLEGSVADMFAQASDNDELLLILTALFADSIPSAYTFTRTGDQFGINSSGTLVNSTTDVSAHISGEGVLLEGARTNLQVQSEDFTAWTAAGGTVTSNNTLAPDGSLADTFVQDTANSQHNVNISTTVSAGTHADSVFLKNNGCDFVSVFPQGVANGSVIFDLRDGSIDSNTSLTNFGIQAIGNGWFRCHATDANASGGGWISAIYCASSGFAAPSFLGNGVSGFHMWGSELEAAAFPSSYIPTAGSTTTRSATSMTRAWPFQANRISGQIKPTVNFDEADAKGSDVLLFEASDGTANNYLRITFDQTNDQIHLTKKVSGGAEVVASTIATNLNYTDGDQLNIRFRANATDGISLEVNSETRVDVATGDGTTDWTILMDQIELHPAFVAVETLRVWNESKSDTFLGDLT